MTKELRDLKKKLRNELKIVKPNGDNIPLNTLYNSAKIDKNISTKIQRV